MVALGEEHADGTTFQVKTELVRYLHEELGFDRVVLEAGLFSCAEMAKELAQGVPASDVTGLCNFRWAECSKEAFTLLEYVAETHPCDWRTVSPRSARKERLIAHWLVLGAAVSLLPCSGCSADSGARTAAAPLCDRSARLTLRVSSQVSLASDAK